MGAKHFGARGEAGSRTLALLGRAAAASPTRMSC